MMGTRTSALAVLLCVAATASAQRPGSVSVDGWCNSGSDQAAYSAATANWEPTPWGDSAAFLIVEAQGSEIDNLRVSNTSNALNLFVGGNLQGGTTALVVAIERPGVPTVTAFAGVDGVPGFFQTEAAGPGLGGATLPPFNYLAMFRFTDPNLDTFPDIEVALLEVATGTITYSGVVSTLDGNVSAAVNFGSALGSAGISNQNVGGVTDSGAVTSPLSVNSGIELSLPLPSFYGSLGPVVPGEVWKIYPFITSFDGESGSNQSVPGNSIVGIVNDPNYQATLVGPLVEHTMLAPAPVPYFVIPTEDERVTLLNNGTSSGTYAIRNSGGVATSLTNVNTPTGFSTTFTGPVVLAPGNVTNVPITFEDNTPGVHEMDETAFVFDNTTIANEITLRNSTLTFDVDGRADESEYTSIGTSAGYHSAGANGLIEAFAAYEADQLLLAATGTLGINESMIFIVDAGFTTSLPAGAPLPGGVFTPSVFNQIAGTRLDQDADFAVRATRTGPTSVGFSLVSYLSSGSPGGEYGYIESHPSDGTPWTGVDGVFTAAFATAANLGAVTDEGFEVLIDIADLGFIPTVHTVEVTAVMTTSGAYTWTSDIIPPVYQQQPGNLGHSPDLRLLAGHQSQWVHGFQGRELDIAQGSRGLFNGSTFQMPRATEATPGTVRTFSILNDGELNLDLFSVTLTGSPALSLENFSATLPATVLPGVPLTFDVRLAGATPDTVSAQLVVMSNDVDEQVTTVTINGIVADSSADLRLAADGTDLPPGGAEDYGLLVEGLRDRTRTFTLQSIGGLPATVSAIQLAFGTQFSISNLSQSLPATLDPDEVLTFDVTLDEATIGNPLDVLSILSDDADAPVYAIDLRGQVTGSRTPLYGTVQVDGELAGDELALGYPYSSQKLLTLFGDASGALIGGGGSEINDLYITNDDEFLYLSIPGNLESNGNNLFVFIDRADDTSGASGIMPELSPPIPFWTFGNSANLNNTTMPDDLNAELMLSLNVRLLSGTIRTTLNIVDIRTLAAEQFFLGHGAPPLDVAINVPGNAIGWAVHGGNTQGVEFGSGLTARPPFTASQGMELRIPFSRIQGTGAPIQPGEIIRVFTGVTNDNGSFWSNQFLPPIATAAGNLGSSTNLSSTGLNLAVASHPILIPPEELLAGADQTVGFEVEPGSELLFEDFDITTPGTLYVVRVPNDENRAGLDRDFLIDEHWSIVAVEGFTFGSATVTFPYDESRLGGVPESSLVAVEKVEGSQHVGSFPILILDTVANTATVEITGPGFSDWYLRGASPASAPQWQIYE